jgi:hypothetical protein
MSATRGRTNRVSLRRHERNRTVCSQVKRTDMCMRKLIEIWRGWSARNFRFVANSPMTAARVVGGLWHSSSVNEEG